MYATYIYSLYLVSNSNTYSHLYLWEQVDRPALKIQVKSWCWTALWITWIMCIIYSISNTKEDMATIYCYMYRACMMCLIYTLPPNCCFYGTLRFHIEHTLWSGTKYVQRKLKQYFPRFSILNFKSPVGRIPNLLFPDNNALFTTQSQK